MTTESKKKTLGMVLKGYPRISETFISNEIRLLEEMGFNIHIYSMRAPRENFSHKSIKDIKAKVTYLPSSMVWGFPAFLWYNIRLFCKMPKRYMECLKLMKSRFALAPKKYTWVKHMLQAGYIMQKSVLDDGVDLAHMHGHFAHTPTTVTMYAAFLADIPFSFTAHAKDIYTQDPRRIQDKVDRAKFVVTCTKYNANHLEKTVGGKKPIHCVYHGINLDLFSPNGRGIKAKTPYHILTVARFVEKKGLDTVLMALAKLRSEGLDFRYTLVGEGKAKFNRKIEKLIQDLGLNDVTTLTGTITHDDVIELLGSSDCFTLGCREAKDGDRDGIPNVVAESMATGVPVTATDVSGVPELVVHEETGLLCPSNDVDALADIIRRSLTDDELRARIIPAANETVHELFNNKKLINTLGEIYKSHGVPCSK
ncbi:colanic acid biosynthesis glycosyltransferase WcaL [Pseudodesulfovibrio nedwellii]|uniref:Colanic acid biosynthesis glycosyltransferase WcaL n=1 Tax=Pseudodesulfovibrio nedwellii TaxID=2973072 RepID=A0ABN6S750_9BACT|nr:glycosyltransferase family 4 protein [Pseudodesulfovibrio nedwellii]BDQ38137.1 colanic acid biosynthesis glycosyltransferase WcaL [Pseudodesulfovibrio nedwellii]